jgi:hypothetical protein
MASRASAAVASLWDPEKQLFADTPSRRTWGHPVNIFALLHGDLPAERREALTRRVVDIARHPTGRAASGGPGGAWPLDEIPSASLYFRFYLARAVEASGAGDDYVSLLEPWRRLLAFGLTTWPEHPEPSRSDCHAWSAHPTLDLLRVVAGIRPVAPGFRHVHVAPGLGSLTTLTAVHPSPLGDVHVQYVRQGDRLHATIQLPPGMTGELAWRGAARPLTSGRQELDLP